MAQQATGKEIFIADFATMDLDKKTCHLHDTAPYNRTKGFITATTSEIRSYVHRDNWFGGFPFPVRALLANLTSLRALDLSRLNITDLPKAIGRLLHLRWLNLSSNQELKMLPKSLTELINLTLFIFHRSGEASFGEDYRSVLRYLPLGMEKMACLTRLNQFILGQRNSSMKREVRLEGLRVSRNLRGSIRIYIRPDCKHPKEYGGGGYLCNTKYFKSIYVKFPYWIHGEERMGNYDDDVLEDLQPYSNLKELAIKRYPGLTISQWARADRLVTSLLNLVKIVLMNYNRLKELPWLGKLQHLKTLQLSYLKNLEYMENKTRGTNIGSSRDRVTTIIAPSSLMGVEITNSSIFFPSLENLKLCDLLKLKRWWKGLHRSAGGQQLPLFPHLSNVTVNYCPNLRSIPLGHAVETLIFWESGIVKEEEGQKVVGGTSSNDSGNSRSNDPKIKEIETTNVRFLNSLPMGLTKMTIFWDHKVESLSEVEEVFHNCSSSLWFLKVKHCQKLRSASRGLEHLTILESLELVDLPEGEEEEEDEEEDDYTGNGMPWRCLAQCLRSMGLHSLHNVVELPKGMHYLTVLQSLEIFDLPLKDVPE
ncbi:hypothetical protein Cgig2_018433 [Carnegiea gigantea]|uniref:R13L1/DRL21-like LRR repeat region domain-containing protein n=1 Tax=Carnegiea gigantea TaxID=171969 RepID=A0A9Q1K784_9CARY|nr:hypothetical protein Cgig2_018433 [Carnegiea gigantea]